MPQPIRQIWNAHFVSGSVQFKPSGVGTDAAIVFLVQIDGPDKQSSVPLKGRFIEVSFTHILQTEAFLKDFVEAINEKGIELPETMG